MVLGPPHGVEDRGAHLRDRVRFGVMAAGGQFQTLGADLAGNHRAFRGQRLDNLQSRTAADSQRNDHHAATVQVWPHVGHVGHEIHAGASTNALAEPRRRFAPDQQEFRPRLLRQNRRENAFQQQPHGIQIRPPVEAAQEHRAIGVARGGVGPEMVQVDAVCDDRHLAGAEFFRGNVRVGRADRDRAIGQREHPPFETLELAPLHLDVTTLDGVRLVLAVTPPDHALDVVGHRHPRAGHRAGKALAVGRPFALPEIDGLLPGHPADCVAQAPAVMDLYRVRQRREQIQHQAGIELRPRFCRQHPVHEHGSNPLGQEIVGRLASLHRILAAISEVRDVVPPGQRPQQVQGADAFARIGRVAKLLVDDRHLQASPRVGFCRQRPLPFIATFQLRLREHVANLRPRCLRVAARGGRVR